LPFEEAISSEAFEAVLARFVFSEEVELLLWLLVALFDEPLSWLVLLDGDELRE
jgi:hypothetical protein